jgi:hypothetical protein
MNFNLKILSSILFLVEVWLLKSAPAYAVRKRFGSPTSLPTDNAAIVPFGWRGAKLLIVLATMGGGASTIGTESIRREWMDVFKAMKLQHGEVKTMFAIYNKVDSDRSGSIDVVELLTLLDIERTAFTERIFSAFDKDHTGKIDFYEFVVSLWKFCTLGNGSLSKITSQRSLLFPSLTYWVHFRRCVCLRPVRYGRRRKANVRTGAEDVP